MKSIFETALTSSHSYTAYRHIVTQLLSEGKSSGNEQSEDLLHYTELNQARMNRLDKTIEITKENCAKLKAIQQPQIWLVLSEGWCGDAAQILPILNKMASCSKQIELNIIFRDENEEVMDLFLTNGTKSIPKLIILNKENLEVIADFGPRPLGAKQLILEYKAKHGVVDETAKTELQKWYLHDKGLSTQNEIIEKITSLILQNH